MIVRKTWKNNMIWTLTMVVLSAVGIGLLSLLYAFGTYGREVFESYFHHPLILLLNIVPVVLIALFFYAVFGRAWAAYAAAAAVVMIPSFGNYYLLKIRDDPLMFQDIADLKEGLAISVETNYDLMPGKRIIFGLIALILGGLFMALFVKGKVELKNWKRAAVIGLCVALMVPCFMVCSSRKVYETKAVNNDAINQWAGNQSYFSRGFVYPFLYSITSNRMDKPDGYHEKDALAALNQYTDTDIPEDRKVSVVTIQLEAFADLSDSGAPGVDWEKAYGTYHGILEESFHGRLLDNVFAGGTYNTERDFLTGFSKLISNFRGKTSSYAWYFLRQGYATQGSHPSYDWFYNRKNVNGYFGIEDYYFLENHYGELSNAAMCPDSVLMPEIYALWNEAAKDGRPVFSFNVSYQGHGPYSDSVNERGVTFTDGRYTPESTNILDNYLGSVQNTAENLRNLLDSFDREDRPVVVVIYGDHRPWLGYGNTVYQELNMDLEMGSDQSLYNKYATDYVIWANRAAKAVTGEQFVGEGDDLSPNFLMNEVFDLCGWKGNRYMQATEEIRRTLSVITTIDRYRYENTYYETAKLPEEAAEALRQFRILEYYVENNFTE